MFGALRVNEFEVETVLDGHVDIFENFGGE